MTIAAKVGKNTYCIYVSTHNPNNESKLETSRLRCCSCLYCCKLIIIVQYLPYKTSLLGLAPSAPFVTSLYPCPWLQSSTSVPSWPVLAHSASSSISEFQCRRSMKFYIVPFFNILPTSALRLLYRATMCFATLAPVRAHLGKSILKDSASLS